MKPAHAPLSISEVNRGKCERQWAARYVSDQWPREYTTGTSTGTTLHGYAQGYLLNGQYPSRLEPIAELFIEGLPFLPKPGGAYLVERKMLTEIGGLPFEWTPDVVSLDGSFIWDHKTCKSFDYVLSEKHDSYQHNGEVKPGKMSDAQALVYSYAAQHPNPTFRHIYYRKTRAILVLEIEAARAAGVPFEVLEKLQSKLKYGSHTPKVKAFDASFTRAELRAQLDTLVLPRAEKLLKLRQKYAGRNPHPAEFEPNISVCPEYGGCAHQGYCRRSPTAYVAGLDLSCYDDASSNPIGDTMSGFQFPPMPGSPVNGPAQAPQAQVQYAPPQQQQPAAPQQQQQQMQFPPVQQLPQNVQQQQMQFPPQQPVAQAPDLSVATYAQRIEQSPHYTAPAPSDAELGAAVRVILRALKAL